VERRPLSQVQNSKANFPSPEYAGVRKRPSFDPNHHISYCYVVGDITGVAAKFYVVRVHSFSDRIDATD
jgi:hypothetical protein